MGIVPTSSLLKTPPAYRSACGRGGARIPGLPPDEPSFTGLSCYPWKTPGVAKERMSGAEVAIEWNGRPARAWLPDPLAVPHPRPSRRRGPRHRTRRRRGDAGRRPAAERLGTPRPAPAPGRRDRVVEHRRSPRATAAGRGRRARRRSRPPTMPRSSPTTSRSSPTRSRTLAGTDRLTVDDLHEWHARLMRNSELAPHLVGAFRDTQGWIGGRGPQDAAYVPPPAANVPALMDDLIAFTNSDEPDVITQAAVEPRAVRDHPPLRRRQRTHRTPARAVDPRSATRRLGSSADERAHRARPRRLPLRACTGSAPVSSRVGSSGSPTSCRVVGRLARLGERSRHADERLARAHRRPARRRGRALDPRDPAGASRDHRRHRGAVRERVRHLGARRAHDLARARHRRAVRSWPDAAAVVRGTGGWRRSSPTSFAV